MTTENEKRVVTLFECPDTECARVDLGPFMCEHFSPPRRLEARPVKYVPKQELTQAERHKLVPIEGQPGAFRNGFDQEWIGLAKGNELHDDLERAEERVRVLAEKAQALVDYIECGHSRRDPISLGRYATIGATNPELAHLREALDSSTGSR